MACQPVDCGIAIEAAGTEWLGAWQLQSRNLIRVMQAFTGSASIGNNW